MKIFILFPIEPIDEEKWHTSDNKGIIVIEASSEDSARGVACKHYREASENTGKYRNTPLCPWNDPDASKCIEYGNECKKLEKEDILFPQQFYTVVCESDRKEGFSQLKNFTEFQQANETAKKFKGKVFLCIGKPLQRSEDLKSRGILIYDHSIN